MLAIIDAYKQGLLRPSHWSHDVIAGLIVGIVALPLAMAFAIASGAKPEQGIYTAIIAALFVGLFGGSRVQIAGPTGAFVVILAGITAHYGIAGLQIATLLAGIILILMGLLKLGSIVKHIPASVITGFTAGIGCLIFLGEWKDFFGLPIHLPLDMPFYLKTSAIFHALPELNQHTLMLALIALGFLLLTPRLLPRIPAPLVAMLAVTALQMTLHFSDVATIGSTFGGIPQTLPRLHWLPLSLATCFILLKPAVTVALLGAIESLLSATAADKMNGGKHHSNQELIGQGIANIMTPLFGGFAATGAIARTATNIKNGGRTPIAAIIHSVLLICVIVFLAPFAANIPLCALAAILFVVAFHMSDLPHVKQTLTSAPWYDILVLVVTFALTLFTDLITAVIIGVLLDVALRLSRQYFLNLT
jgi:SulP family sulfate permease